MVILILPLPARLTLAYLDQSQQPARTFAKVQSSKGMLQIGDGLRDATVKGRLERQILP